MTFSIHQNFTDKAGYSKQFPSCVTDHPQTLSRCTPELMSHRWQCCSHMGSALTEGRCPLHSFLISPTEEQQSSQLLRTCTPLLRVLNFFTESELSHKLSVLFYSTPPWALSGIYGAEQAFIGCHHTRSTSLSFGHGCAPNAILKAFWETIVDEQILLRKCTHPALGEIPLWTTLVHTHSLCSILPGTKGRYTGPNQPTERPTLVNGSLMFPQKRTQKLVIGQLLLWNKFYEQKD